jgi:hypothetical protein
MARLPTCLLLACGLFIAPLLSGCGGGSDGSVVKVSVTSSKVKLEDTDAVEVIFIPQGTPPAGAPTNATVNGSIKDQPIPAGRGEIPGVLPGKYNLTVRITPYAGQAAPERVNAINELNKALEAGNSTRTYEVVAGQEQTITIDLDSNTVTKK